MSKVKNFDDIITIIFNEISTNSYINKELKRSTLNTTKIIDIYKSILKVKLFRETRINLINLGIWFESFKTKNLDGYKFWEDDLNNVFLVFEIINAITVDVYTTARMFKIFNVKENEHYPKKPHNIVYYAGNGHTIPMADFLQKLGFIKTEQSDNKIISCVSMEGIKQPLFS